jgi:mannose-1-phosphate guanylyltransferase
MTSAKEPWVIILAGGSGERLRSITATTDGRWVPKQFCRLGGRGSMLGTTLARGRGLTAAERIVVLVLDEHRRWWEAELADVLPDNIRVQQHNRGTGQALLDAVLHVDSNDPDSCVVVLPSDHVVDDEAILNAVLRDAVDESDRSGDHIVLIGAASTVPDPSLGWIIPGRTSTGHARAVTAFVEKPSLAAAGECVRRGALRNTLMLAAGTRALLRAYALAWPDWSVAATAEGDALPAMTWRQTVAHGDLPAVDLSRDILQRVSRWLRVLPLPECGWSDVGTLERLEAWWAHHPTVREQVRRSGLLPHWPPTEPTVTGDSVIALGAGARVTFDHGDANGSYQRLATRGSRP